MYGKVIVVCCMLLFLLAACASAESSTSSQSAAPILVTAKSVQGMSGSGPIVVSMPAPDGNANGQQAVLKDRILVLDSVSKQDTTDGHSSLIALALTVRNTSDKPIMNQSAFFQLMSVEGDIFTYQYGSSGHFYDMLSAHSSRDGTVVFQIPTAAASHLQLLYHPEATTESVLMLLKI
jgi:hypothetical protein